MRFVVSFLFLIACIGCRRDQSQQAAALIEQRVSAFKIKKQDECHKALLREAEKTVDSLLMAEAKIHLEDSLSRMRPVKPEQPPPVEPLDSLPVKPIFDKKGN